MYVAKLVSVVTAVLAGIAGLGYQVSGPTAPPDHARGPVAAAQQPAPQQPPPQLPPPAPPALNLSCTVMGVSFPVSPVGQPPYFYGGAGSGGGYFFSCSAIAPYAPLAGSRSWPAWTVGIVMMDGTGKIVGATTVQSPSLPAAGTLYYPDAGGVVRPAPFTVN